MIPNYIDPELYKSIVESLPIACVDICVVDKGRVLLVLRKDKPAQGQWWVPGGRVWKGEKMKETARRKAMSEVGIECHIGPIIHTDETIFPDGPLGVPIHSINSCFMLYPVEPIEKMPPELDSHQEKCKWVRSIPEGLHPYVQKCLLAAGLEFEKKEMVS